MKISAATPWREHMAYMERVGKEKIPCYEPVIGEEELKLLGEVVRSNWLSEGEFTREFERKLGKISGRKYAVALCNATAGMIIGMKAVGLKAGDEVIVPSLSHAADPNSVAAAGAKPVFADVDKMTWCLSVATIEAVRTPRTKAVLLVNVYGQAADMAAITSYCRRNGLILINDSAAALGTKYQGKSIGSFGDFAVLSFFADKTVTTGEGGMLLTDSKELLDEVQLYKHDGRRERGHDLIERAGYNFRFTELQAAVGVAQLGKLTAFIKRKDAIQRQYKQGLAHIEEIDFMPKNKQARIVPHRIVILVPKARDLITYLGKEEIGARTLFAPMHSQPAYDVGGGFPVTNNLYLRGVCLPSAPSLKDQEVAKVIDKIKKFYAQ